MDKTLLEALAEFRKLGELDREEAVDVASKYQLLELMTPTKIDLVQSYDCLLFLALLR
jgi:hypothetical protein